MKVRDLVRTVKPDVGHLVRARNRSALEQRMLSVDQFPCEIREGDEFHFACIGDFIELRCGKRESQR